MANLPVILFQSLTTSSVDESGHLLVFPLASKKATGCGFYGQSDPFHTISYATTMGFIGIIKLQGSLVNDPVEEDWYDIQGTTLGNGITPVTNQTLLINFNGKHVWVRAIIVSFAAGQLNSATLTHN
jgi:hypothetical protein